MATAAKDQAARVEARALDESLVPFLRLLSVVVIGALLMSTAWTVFEALIRSGSAELADQLYSAPVRALLGLALLRSARVSPIRFVLDDDVLAWETCWGRGQAAASSIVSITGPSAWWRRWTEANRSGIQITFADGSILLTSDTHFPKTTSDCSIWVEIYKRYPHIECDVRPINTYLREQSEQARKRQQWADYNDDSIDYVAKYSYAPASKVKT